MGGAHTGSPPFWRQDQCRSSVLHRKFLSSGFWSLRGTQSRRRVFSCCDSGGIEPAIPSIFCFNSLCLLGGPRCSWVCYRVKPHPLPHSKGTCNRWEDPHPHYQAGPNLARCSQKERGRSNSHSGRVPLSSC